MFNTTGISLVAATLMVAAGSILLQKAWHRDIDAAEALLSIVIIGFAWVTISGMVLGVAGRPGLLYRMLADALYLTAAFLFYSKFFPLKKNIERNPGPLKSFPVMMIAGVGVAIAAAAWVWAWVSPPPAWDAFVYHLGFPASWLNRSRIFLVMVPFGDQAGTYFPSNVELIYLWLLTYTGQDFSTNVTQWFFTITCVAAVYRLSRITGASQAVALCSSFSVFFMPSIIHQAVSSEVDIAFSAMFVSSLYFLLRWRENPTIRFNLFLSMLAAGLFLGTKTIALPWTLFLYLPLFCIITVKRGLRPWMLTGMAAAAVPGGFWYVRNIAVTGNPVFPLSLNIFGLNLLPGAYTRATMLNSLFHTESFMEWAGLLAGDWGIPLLAITLASALLVLAGHRRDRVHRICFGAGPFLVLIICFCIVPYNREVRFAYTAFLLGAVAVGMIISRAEAGIPRLLTVIAAIYVSNLFPLNNGQTEFFKHLLFYIKNLAFPSNMVLEQMRPGAAFMGAAATLAAATVFLSLIRQNWISYTKWTFALSGILIFCGISLISSSYPVYQYQYYRQTPMGESWAVFHMRVPTPVRVAYSGTDLFYGLTGPKLKNTVYHVPVNRHGFQHFHECNKYLKTTGEYSVPESDRIDFCRRDPDFNVWFDRLAKLKTEFFYVSVLHQNDLPHLPHDEENFPIERAWADSHPDLFRPVYLNRYVRIYELFY